MSSRWCSPGLRHRLLVGMEPERLYKHPRRNYIVQCVLSCPPWVKRRELVALEEEAKRKTKETGVRHVVDHIIPVTHPLVCGLTVPWNLQVITAAQNAYKSNRWTPEQMELWATPTDAAGT